ncbi:MAG: DUF2914 domain-containing protein [Candidatus Halalkalibacterium sp. M3_1C_030]
MPLALKTFLSEHKKYAPVIFFMGGFIWDSLTLGRIDGWYSNTILFVYLISLTVSIYIFNLSEDGRWKNTFLEPYQEYAPYAIQFFLGGLSSAYVIFFFQSVSFTKTMVFFGILVMLLFGNEFLKHRISNKYLQFGAYFFVNFTFCIFFLPILFGFMNTFLFIVSGIAGLISTLYLIRVIYRKSPSTRKDIHKKKLLFLIFGIYILMNGCYYFNLIPPVPLSLQEGMVAYDVKKTENTFEVTYEQSAFPNFWKSFDPVFHHSESDSVFVYTSIFAPTDLTKSVQHRWQWYDSNKERWMTTDTIHYEVTGGRKGGYRGYTFKKNIWAGPWQVEVTTDNGLVLGVIEFTIVSDSTKYSRELTTQAFR